MSIKEKEVVKFISNEDVIMVNYVGDRTKTVVYFSDEKFTPVPNHPTYLVSTYGRVFSINKEKMLNQFPDKDGYLRLGMDGKKFSSHRIVAQAFLPKDSENYGDQINHINGRKTDNRPENLEWVNCKKNIQHAIDTGLRNSMYGETNPSAIYSNEQVKKECELLQTYPGITSIKIAKILGLNLGDKFDKHYSDHITKLRRGVTFKNIVSNYNTSYKSLTIKKEIPTKEIESIHKTINKECSLILNDYPFEYIAKIMGKEYTEEYKNHLQSIYNTLKSAN